MSLIWQFDTSVWYQSLRNEDDQYILERYYKERDVDEFTILCSPSNVLNSTTIKYPSHIDEYGTCTFKLKGSMPLLSVVTDPNADEETLMQLIDQLGSTISKFHNIQAPDKCPQPANFRRLKAYVTDRRNDAADYLLSHFDSSELNSLKDLINTYSVPETGFVHGGLGLGTMFVADDNSLEIPTGPDSGAFNPVIDLAWIVGELTELEHASLNSKNDGSRYAYLANRYIKAYENASGIDINIRQLLQLSTLRTALHYLDFASTYPTLDPHPENVAFLKWLIERAVE